MYDVLIVGAGPAGGYLAYLLSRAGYHVLVIDKAKFPRPKTCGGGISHKTVSLIDFDLSPVIRRRIVGAWLTYQNHDTVIKDLPNRGGAAVIRSEFDWFILRHAMEHGATFFDGSGFQGVRNLTGMVEVSTSRGVFTSRYLIGADGVYSQVRNSIFGKDLVRYAPAVEALVYVPPDVIERFENRVLFDFGGMPKGYGWIFPKGDHLNVGVFSIFPRREIQRDLHAFMRLYRSLASYTKLEVHGYSIPLSNTRQQFQRGEVMLVGDAAGFAESVYGEGIYFALKSAQVAAEAIGKSFDKPGDHLYTDLVRKQLHADLLYSELNAKMVFPVQKFGFYWMVRNSHVNHYFAELIAGSVSHRECFYKTLLTSPYWIFSRKLPAYRGESL